MSSIEDIAVEDYLKNFLEYEHPDIKAFVLALKSFQELKRGKARTLGEVADALKVPKDTLYRAIRDFEDKVEGGKNVFLKTSGKGTTKVAEDAEKLFRNIEEMLRCYQRVLRIETGSRPRIRIGAALTLCTHLVPKVLRAFHEAEPDAGEVEIEVKHGLPQVLRDRAQNGELDLVLTTCPAHLDELEAAVVKAVDLPMRLVCASNHPLVRQEQFDWNDLKGSTVVLLTEDRVPMPRYPLDLLPDDVRIVRVESYPQAHNLVLGGGDTVCFSFPQLFSREEKRLLDAIKMDELGSVRLCLIRSQRAKELHGKDENALIDRLTDEFADQLRKIDEEYDRYGLSKARGTRRIYHAGRIGDKKKGLYVWLGGRLDFRFTEDGYVKGEHRIYPPGNDDSDPVVYSIFGHVARNPNGKCHLLWRGTRQAGGDVEEDSQVSFICNEPDLLQGPLVGVWIGRQTWTALDFDFVPAAGYVVIVKSDKTVPLQQLHDYVRAYEATHAKLELIRPDLIKEVIDRRKPD